MLRLVAQNEGTGCSDTTMIGQLDIPSGSKVLQRVHEGYGYEGLA